MPITVEDVPYQGSKTLVPLLMFAVLLRNLIWVLPSPLMSELMEDMNISYMQGGMLMFIVTALMGAAMFGSSFLIDRLGAVQAIITGLFSFGVDGLLSWFFRGYTFVLVGRAFSGIGYGMIACAVPALISARVNRAQYNLANSFFSAFNAISIAIAYSVTVPMFQKLGSWRRLILVWSVFAILCAVMFIRWMRGKANTTQNSNKNEGKNGVSSLLSAWKYPQLKCLTVAMMGCLWLQTCISTYLPTFLSEVHGYAPEDASAATGLMSISGIAGCFLCGVLLKNIRNRKAYMIGILAMMAFSVVGISVLPFKLGKHICICLAGFCFMGWTPMSMTIIMSLPAVTPQIVGGATAIMIGSGSILAFIVPVIFDLLQGILGIQNTFLVFSLLIIPAVISVKGFALKE